MMSRIILALGLLWQSVHLTPAAVEAAAPDTKRELRGRLVCLAEEMQQKYQAPIAANHQHLTGFKTEQGEYFTLLRSKTSEALFSDKRLWERELILTGRLFPGTRIFDSFSMRSIKDGKQYDIFYYCDVCAIEAVTPEECQCCRAPVEFVERPLF